MMAFVMNAVAYEHKIVERHSFRLMHPEDSYVETTHIKWEGNVLAHIAQKNQFSDIITKTGYKSWLDNEPRFSCDNTSAWKITNNDRTDKGLGLVNVSGGYTGFKILNLKAGDIVRFSYFLNSEQSHDYVKFKSSSTISGRHQSWSDQPVTSLEGDKVINGTYDIFIESDGELHIDCPSKMLLREVTITLAEYRKATFDIEEVDGGNGNVGFKFTITGSGVLEEKHPAVPYMTMAFGNDDDMTIVKNFGSTSSHSVSNYNDLEHGGTNGYVTKSSGGDINRTPTIISDPNPLDWERGNHCVSVHCNANESQDWNAQFWAVFPKYFSEGEKVKVKFRYKARVATEANISIQGHGTPSDYRNNLSISNLAFDTQWKTFDEEITVPGSDKSFGMKSIALNLAGCKTENDYYFDNLNISYDEAHNDPNDIESKCFAASSIVDPSHNLNIDNPEVKLSAIYKKRYHNQNNQYVAFALEDGQYNNVGDQTEQDRVKALAQEEVNALYGREWTVFKAENNWDSSNRSDYDSWKNARIRSYRWGDDFATIWPQYGTYFYFFPDVKGKLSVKFYCEGVNENMPFWWKAQDGSVVDVCVTNPNDNDGDNDSRGKVYEYKDIDVVAGGAYYLCANPTLVNREHPVVRLISYTFIPDFLVKPLWKVVDNGTEDVDEACIIYGGPFSDLEVNKNRSVLRNGENAPEVKFLGNIEDATFTIENTDDGNQRLKINSIKYKHGNNINRGGAIVVNLHCNASTGTNTSKNLISFVLTVAYKASEAEWGMDNGKAARLGKTTEVKRWDFFTDKLAVGQYKDGSGTYPSDAWTNSSTLYKEVHKYDGLTTDWVISDADILTPGKEPIFKSVYDFEGDNADMLEETEGLIIHSETNLLGIYNENNPSTSDFQDRYIGFMGKGDWDYQEHPRQLIIPFLKKDDRVVIKMGTYGNTDNSIATEQATLRFNNAKDANGKLIDGDYIIGGSIPYPNETATAKAQPHGEYHFQAAEDGNFVLEVKDAKLLKIYSIVIYRNAANDNADILTENEVTTADGPELLFTDDDDESKDMEFFLRYSGYEEPKEFGNYDPNYTRGNLGSLNAASFTDGSTPYSKKVSFQNTDFGSFRAVAQVKTTDAANTYVTDYAKGSLAVGYLKKVETGYPYTWDFTDLLTVSNDYVKNAIGQEEQSSTLPDDYKGWTEKNGSCLRNAPENESGVLFANGGQLYASTTMFKETAGLGFKRSTDDAANAKKQNNSVTLVSGGTEGMLKVDHPTDNNEFTKIVIPKVDANAAIYIRATPIEHATVKAQYSTDGLSGQDLTSSDVTYPAGSSDKIYAMKNDGEQRNVELWLNGLAIKKIAVSTAPKKLNAKGWATESRKYVTDPALTAYMTGKDIRTYIVTEVDYKNKQVTLERIDAESGNTTFQGYLMPAATDGDNNASILLNFKSKGDKGIEGEPVSLIDDGFHIFVPDMHDAKDKVTWSHVGKTNYLVSQVSGSEESPAEIPAVKDGFTNFAFTSTYVDIDPETGAIKSDPKTGAQAFYRIAGGTNGKATSKGHQGYLPIKIEENTDGAARFNLMIIDGDEATGVTSLEQVAEDNGRYFNLNGQQLSGKPNRSGLYIVNGKKVYVKNK